MALIPTLAQPLVSFVQTHPFATVAVTSTASFVAGVCIREPYQHARRRSIEVLDTLSHKYRYPNRRDAVRKKFHKQLQGVIKKRRDKPSLVKSAKISHIYKNFFLGSKSGLQEETFDSLGITQLLYLSEEPCPKVSENIEVLDLGKESEGFFRLLRATSFADFDRKKMETWFQKAFRFLDKGILDGKVSVCCTLGRVRSATVVIAYFMHRFTLDFATAKSFVESKREIGLDAFAKKYLTDYGDFCKELSGSGLTFEPPANLLQIV